MFWLRHCVVPVVFPFREYINAPDFADFIFSAAASRLIRDDEFVFPRDSKVTQVVVDERDPLEFILHIRALQV